MTGRFGRLSVECRWAGALALSALLLYLPGLGWGLPYATAATRIDPWGPDELAPLGSLGELSKLFLSAEGPMNPQYPLLQYVVQALFTGPYALWLRATGGVQGMASEYPFGLEDPVSALAAFTVLSRLPSLLMAAGTVAVAFKTASGIWGRRAGIFAALAVMLCYPMFYYSRTSNVDIAALFWASLGLHAFSRCLVDGITRRRVVWLGLFAALATATKDASYALFALVAVVLVALVLRDGRKDPPRLRSGISTLLWGGLATGVAYAVASGLVFSLDRFAAHVTFITGGAPLPEGVQDPAYFTHPASPAGYLGVTGETAGHTIGALGVPLALASLLGLLLAARRRERVTWLALPALGILVGVIWPVRFVNFRFVIPIAYLAAIFAGQALAVVTGGGRGRLRQATTVLAVLALAWAGLRGLDLTRQMRADSRYELSDWLRRNARAGDTIGYYGSRVKLPHLERDVVAGPMPGQPAYAEEEPLAEPPEFILVIPQQDFEPVHEWTMPEATYRDLVAGRAGYRPWLALRTQSAFGRGPIHFVNPPVRLFVRDDVVPRLHDPEPVLRLSDG